MKFRLEYVEKHQNKLFGESVPGFTLEPKVHDIEAADMQAAEQARDTFLEGKTLAVPSVLHSHDEYLKSLFRTFTTEEHEEDDVSRIAKTGVECCIPQCTGEIVEETTQKYFGDPMHEIVGPGHKNQLTAIVVLYCSQCGVQYRKLPKLLA